MATAWEVLEDLDLTLHPLEDGLRVVTLARRLGRQSAYDAAYIALAERLGAELWTLDGKLAANAGAVGFPVHTVF
jgi:predicted nucleic acid-binding protein